MKVQIKKAKFIRNVIIGVIALFIVAFIINTAPGYRRDKYADIINLIIEDTNVTEKLKKPIYTDEAGTIYMSQEDIKNLLDKTLYYDQDEKMIIATSEVSVSSMKLDEKVMTINGATVDTLYKAMEIDNTIYIPIEELEIVYNIEVKYLKDKQIVIIDKLNEGMVKAEATEEATIKYRPRKLSKKVGTLKAGDIVNAFYTTSKGWRLIRTEDGTLGYVKANVLTNECILRQDMLQDVKTKHISIETKDGTRLTIEGETIVIRDILSLTKDGILLRNNIEEESGNIWVNLKIQDVQLNKYEERCKYIKNIIKVVMKNNINGINVLIDENSEYTERFIIELAPRLRELGIKTNVVLKENTNSDNYKTIVNYIIENK